jgi:hypothetical protein
MRNQLLFLPAVTVAVLLVADIRGAMAGGDNPTPVPIPGVPPAPIGHRQPQPSELPRGVLDDESAGRTTAQKAIDRKLENSVCNKC